MMNKEQGIKLQGEILGRLDKFLKAEHRRGLLSNMQANGLLHGINDLVCDAIEANLERDADTPPLDAGDLDDILAYDKGSEEDGKAPEATDAG